VGLFPIREMCTGSLGGGWRLVPKRASSDPTIQMGTERISTVKSALLGHPPALPVTRLQSRDSSPSRGIQSVTLLL
jgi:hypothetical protein